MSEYVSVDPTEYYVFHPRPAYLVVTRDPAGKLNVMAVSWVTPASEEPPLIALAIGKESYTHEILMKTDELTVNVVGEDKVDLVYRAGTVSGRDVDKWRMLGLEEEPSERISVPGIKGSYAIAECRVKNRVDAGECTLFICEILNIKVLKDYYTRYGWDLRKARILLHNSGRAFTIPGRLVFARK